MEETPHTGDGDSSPARGVPDLQALIRQLPAGVVLAEIPGGRILFVNDELERILGHGLLESPKVDSYGRWGAVHADGRPFAANDHPLARAVLHLEVIENEEVRYRRPDGDLRFLSVNAGPIRDAAGRPVAAVATFVDLTDRKREEMARAFLAEAGRVLVSSLDVRETLQSTVDLAALNLSDLAMIYLRDAGGGYRLALSHADPAVVHRLGGGVHGRPLPPDHPAVEVIRTGRTVDVPRIDAATFDAMALDEAHRAVFTELGLEAILMVPLVGREQPEGAFGFAVTRGGRRIDANLRATAEELGRLAGLAVENARLYEQARTETRLREEVLAVVSHDLRNPLSLMKLATKGLLADVERGLDARRVERMLDLVESAASRMGRLIDDLLDAERMAAARFTVQPRSEPIVEILEEAVVGARILADQASVILSCRASRDATSARVICDRDRILQLLANLLENAIKYTPAGGTVEAVCDGDGDGVRLSVADTGEGVPEADRKRIFDRFWQRDASRPGTGLGLAIARGIVEAHGGRIWVEGREGPGAVFHVWLAGALD